MTSTIWDAETRLEVKTELRKALRLRRELERAPWWNCRTEGGVTMRAHHRAGAWLSRLIAATFFAGCSQTLVCSKPGVSDEER